MAWIRRRESCSFQFPPRPEVPLSGTTSEFLFGKGVEGFDASVEGPAIGLEAKKLLFGGLGWRKAILKGERVFEKGYLVANF